MANYLSQSLSETAEAEILLVSYKCKIIHHPLNRNLHPTKINALCASNVSYLF